MCVSAYAPLAMHRSSTERMLIEARQDQIHHKEHFLAVQAQRDREEFERVLRSVWGGGSTAL